MNASYEYEGEATCAADGMCQEKCPVKINTGDMIKYIRAEQMKEWKNATGVAGWLGRNFGVMKAVPTFLNLVSGIHGVVGAKPLEFASRLLNKWTDHAVPVWNPYMPKGAKPLGLPPAPAAVAVPVGAAAVPRKVVYVPSCVTRMMGPSRSDDQQDSVHEVMMRLFAKAGYEVVLPKGISNSCCGMLFNSRGFKDAAAAKGAELEAAILEASEGGKLPVVLDTSPCLAQVKASISEPALRFALYEPVEFIR